MMREPEPLLVQRTLFDGEWLQVGYIAVRPVSSECGEVETSPLNVLALPLAGVFAKHDGPRQRALVTPDHALLISAHKPYRLSFPGRIGDRCLALRFTSAALSRVMPHSMAGDGFDAARFAPHALLPPAVMLARSQLFQRLARGQVETLEAEELGLGLLAAALGAARLPHADRGDPDRAAPGTSARRRRLVERTIEAIGSQPERRWTLGDLAEHASVSPYHLAHVFRADVGISVYGYAMRSRLARALDAVLDGDDGLTEIALDAGFASHSHFTARFRALFGHTPAQLRRGVDDSTVRDLRKIVTARETVAA
jgi:AraC-like DNA-binding protein